MNTKFSVHAMLFVSENCRHYDELIVSLKPKLHVLRFVIQHAAKQSVRQIHNSTSASEIEGLPEMYYIYTVFHKKRPPFL